MGLNVVENNIKQQALPFVLNPSSALHTAEGGINASGTAPEIFSFRGETKVSSGSGRALLGFCPASLRDNIGNDMSFKLLYPKKIASFASPTSLTYNDIVQALPAVSIREYIPDTALDQVINFCVGFVKEVMNLFGSKGMSTDVLTKTEESNVDNQNKKQASVFDKLTAVMKFVMQYITGQTDPDLVTSIVSSNTAVSKIMNDKKILKKIVDFPYLFYYKLQSCLTTAIYEVPAIKKDNMMYSSDGYPGWTDSEDTGMRFLPASLTKLPLVGSLLGKMFGNIAISWMPWWDPINGGKTAEPEVQLEFDLYNDNVESALMNFIFVNTIVPNNKWIQYGLFQHSSHVYDVRLEGFNRLFACAGKFEVSYLGVLRDPPACWFVNGKYGLSKFVNKNYKAKDFVEELRVNHTIKVPDIYHVKMTFSSLLPTNFNQYLYSLIANTNQIQKYGKGAECYQPSDMAPAIIDGLTGLITGAKETWDKT